MARLVILDVFHPKEKSFDSSMSFQMRRMRIKTEIVYNVMSYLLPKRTLPLSPLNQVADKMFAEHQSVLLMHVCSCNSTRVGSLGYKIC